MSNPFTLRTSPRKLGLIWDDAGANISTGDSSPDTKTYFTCETAAPVGNGFMTCDGDNLAKITCIANQDDNGAANGKFCLTHVVGFSEAPDYYFSGQTRVNKGIWVPTHIATFKWTFGLLPGLASRTPNQNWFFAKNVELIDGDTSVRLITDTGDNGIASVTVDLEGAQALGIGFDHTGVTEADNINALVGVI